MHITQWGEYGVHCAAFLAKRAAEGRQTIPASEIAEAQGIPLDYAQQILQRLRKKSIVQSVRGPQGGYKLSRSAANISLHDILLATEGNTFEIICETKPIDSNRCAPSVECNLRAVWFGLRNEVNKFLSSLSLEDVINQNNKLFFESSPIQINRSS